MSAPDASLVPEVIAAYESVTINIEFALAVTAILLYDTILTLDKEIQNIWRSPRRWHQRALYIINRYAVLVGHILELGTTHPIANRYEQLCDHNVMKPIHSVRTSDLTAVCQGIYSRNGVHNYWALGGRRCHLAKNLVVMATTIGDRDSKPSTDLAQRDVSIRNDLLRVSSVMAFQEHAATEKPSSTMLLLIITTDTLWLLSITNSSVNSLAGYLQGFAITLPNILTSRFMLDIWETNAKIERGGATNTGSFSLDLDRAGTSDGPAGHCGDTIRTLEFVHSYGGPAPSYLTDDENEDEGDAQGESEDMNANANATATDEEARSYHPEAGVALSGMASGSGSAHETIIAWNAQR
ncbi:hypothetical protein C8Q77DRAFT_1162472 [Trametes polyzona]|nr:hypothetical protein C8Q77DRAFT_1162472 [Trametes polyzona]